MIITNGIPICHAQKVFLHLRLLARKSSASSGPFSLQKLKSDGVGADAKHMEAISAEEEKQLWKSGVLNVSTPTGLLRAVFYMCRKCFCLRGGLEHTNLSVSH